jgi:hypothetical protein
LKHCLKKSGRDLEPLNDVHGVFERARGQLPRAGIEMLKRKFEDPDELSMLRQWLYDWERE